MTKNWILVANRTDARVFEHLGPGSGLTKLMEFSHPEGRLKDQDLASDQGGRAYDSEGSGRHRMEQRESPKEHEDRHFAHDLGKAMSRGLQEHKFTRLFLVAEAGFLGDLKAALDKKTSSLLGATLDKDLVHVEDRDVADHLGDLLKL